MWLYSPTQNKLCFGHDANVSQILVRIVETRKSLPFPLFSPLRKQTYCSWQLESSMHMHLRFMGWTDWNIQDIELNEGLQMNFAGECEINLYMFILIANIQQKFISYSGHEQWIFLALFESHQLDESYGIRSNAISFESKVELWFGYLLFLVFPPRIVSTKWDIISF